VDPVGVWFPGRGLLVKPHESDLSVATNARDAGTSVAEALKVGAKLTKANWSLASLAISPRQTTGERLLRISISRRGVPGVAAE